MTTREWLEELTGHVRGGHVVRNDDAARLLDLLQRMQADVQGNWEAWQAAIARAETAEAALDDMIAQRDGALATAGIAEAKVEILRARAETAEAALERSGTEGLNVRAELADVYRRAETAEAALAERDKPCVWTRAGDGTYRDCHGGYWNPDDKGRFCPCCGRPIEVAEAQP